MSATTNMTPEPLPVVSAGERSEPPRTIGRGSAALAHPDPEVGQTPARRLFSADYKRRILAECDRATAPGQVGAILRREGLFSFHLRDWRGARKRAETQAFAPKRHGPRPARPTALEAELQRVQRENARLQHKLQQAELIIELQKKSPSSLGRRSLNSRATSQAGAPDGRHQ